MLKKATVAALFLVIAFLPLTGIAAGDPSYFEGDWAGRWPGFKSEANFQDAAINISKGNAEGVFLVVYSWEGGPTGSGFPTFPGSVKAKGKVEGDQLVFGWKNKQGREITVTLKKHEENKIKAKLEKSGPTMNNERPINEAIFHRK